MKNKEWLSVARPGTHGKDVLGARLTKRVREQCAHMGAKECVQAAVTCRSNYPTLMALHALTRNVYFILC